ncbi:hypothetical protein F8388_012397 [Cannabis sativa]|uniref:Retrotransposon Copia-like N-terminal domain-containing protein n=1 Tax=Cannabis sativa TaxID=3483 RepID=A0A7J6G2T7_CANSA|nr:hypothetical protein G4B88_019936 [Cannabis sativa]KAF4377296.1 hypothetical protein F8388_012397 [Cannabis sativa]
MARTRATGSRNSGHNPPPISSSTIPDAPNNEDPIIPPAPVITGEHSTTQNRSIRPPHEDSSSPYYLSSGDHPGLTLVTPPLSDLNFQAWRRDFELSVGARNKTGTMNKKIGTAERIGNLYFLLQSN